jgi:hypothetical protein
VGIPVFLGEWDQDIIDTALAIASLERVESVQQVDQLLETMRLRYDVGGGQPRYYPASSVKLVDLQNDHEEWSRWLKQIRQGGALQTKDYDSLREQLGAVKATPVLGPNKRGLLHTTWKPWMTGLKSVYTYAAALMLDPRNKLKGRVGRCHFENCDRGYHRYFIDWDAYRKGTRKRMKFCCPKHENSQHSRKERRKERDAKAAAKHK